MKVFLTGGATYLGTSVIQSLLTHGHSVVALAEDESEVIHLLSHNGVAGLIDQDRVLVGSCPHGHTPNSLELQLPGPTPCSQVRVVCGHIGNIPLLVRAAGQCDATIHLHFAGDAYMAMTTEDTEEKRGKVAGEREVLNAIARSYIRTTKVLITAVRTIQFAHPPPGGWEEGSSRSSVDTHHSWHSGCSEDSSRTSPKLRSEQIPTTWAEQYAHLGTGSSDPSLRSEPLEHYSDDRIPYNHAPRRHTGPLLETDPPPFSSPALTSELCLATFGSLGVRTAVIRIPPLVYGMTLPIPGMRGHSGVLGPDSDRGSFLLHLLCLVKQEGYAPTERGGRNRWPSVHVRDLGNLFRLAVERAPDGYSCWHAVGNCGHEIGGLARVVAERAGVPAKDLTTATELHDHSRGHVVATYQGYDNVVSSALTRGRLGWRPRESDLLEDLQMGMYLDMV